MKVYLQHRPSSRSVALALLALALLLAAAIAAAFTREADTEAARANSGLQPLVLVAGAAGEAGRLIAQRAHEQGFAARAASGDLRQQRAAHDAVRGVEFVVCGLAGQIWQGPETQDFVGYREFVNLVTAARAARVRHFVLISSVWAGLPVEESLQSGTRQLIHWKTKAEDYLKASGMPYTVVSPGELRSAQAGASGLRAVRRQDYQSASVSRADLARVAIDALRNPLARNKSFAIFNDPDATPEAWRKELYAVRRDAPAIDSLTGGAAASDGSRVVVPAPSRERLMIEEETEDELPPVEWSTKAASSQ